MRLVCTDRFAGVEQLVSLRRTDKPGKPEDAAASREDAQFHLGKTDTRSFVHDANIAGQRDLGSSAQCDTIQRRDDRHRQLLEGPEGFVLAGEFAGNHIVAHMGKFADVGTGAERFAPRTRHYDGTHPLVGRNVSAGEQELVEGDKGGEVERRVVEAKHHDAAIVQTVVDEGALRHDQILSGVRAASGRNSLLWTVEIMTSRHSIMSVRVTGYDRARIRRNVVLGWRGGNRSTAPRRVDKKLLAGLNPSLGFCCGALVRDWH